MWPWSRSRSSATGKAAPAAPAAPPAAPGAAAPASGALPEVIGHGVASSSTPATAYVLRPTPEAKGKKGRAPAGRSVSAGDSVDAAGMFSAGKAPAAAARSMSTGGSGAQEQLQLHQQQRLPPPRRQQPPPQQQNALNATAPARLLGSRYEASPVRASGSASDAVSMGSAAAPFAHAAQSAAALSAAAPSPTAPPALSLFRYLGVARPSTQQVTSVAANALARTIVSGCSDGSVSIWDLPGQRLLARLQGRSEVTSVAISPSGRTVVSGSDDKRCRVWQLEPGIEPALRQWEDLGLGLGGAVRSIVLEGHTDHVTSVATSETVAVSGSNDCSVRLWALPGGELLNMLGQLPSVVSCVTLLSSNSTVVFGSADCRVRLWEPDSGRLEAFEGGHSSVVSCLAVAGNTVISGSHDTTVVVWDMVDRKQRLLLVGHRQAVTGVAILGAATIISGSHDKDARLWSLESGELLHTVEHAEEVTSVAAAGGRTFVSGCTDNSVSLWEWGGSRTSAGAPRRSSTLAWPGNIIRGPGARSASELCAAMCEQLASLGSLRWHGAGLAALINELGPKPWAAAVEELHPLRRAADVVSEAVDQDQLHSLWLVPDALGAAALRSDDIVADNLIIGNNNSNISSSSSSSSKGYFCKRAADYLEGRDKVADKLLHAWLALATLVAARTQGVEPDSASLERSSQALDSFRYHKAPDLGLVFWSLAGPLGVANTAEAAAMLQRWTDMRSRVWASDNALDGAQLRRWAAKCASSGDVEGSRFLQLVDGWNVPDRDLVTHSRVTATLRRGLYSGADAVHPIAPLVTAWFGKQLEQEQRRRQQLQQQTKLRPWGRLTVLDAFLETARGPLRPGPGGDAIYGISAHECTLGRAPTCDLRVDNARVGLLHARFFRDGWSPMLEDCASGSELATILQRGVSAAGAAAADETAQGAAGAEAGAGAVAATKQRLAPGQTVEIFNGDIISLVRYVNVPGKGSHRKSKGGGGDATPTALAVVTLVFHTGPASESQNLQPPYLLSAAASSPPPSVEQRQLARQQQHQQQGSELASQEGPYLVSLARQLGVPAHQVLEAEELVLGGVIGSGSFGTVRDARWRGMRVAVKYLRGGFALGQQRPLPGSEAEAAVAESDVRELLHEAAVMARVSHHCNIVPFVGLLLRPPCVVTQFMVHGSLEELLGIKTKPGGVGAGDGVGVSAAVGGGDNSRSSSNSNNSNNKNDSNSSGLSMTLSEQQLLSMLADAAAGVLHLHLAGVVHRDLACRNLLVDELLRVRVADFGFSRVKEANESKGVTVSQVGPLKWMAPEALELRQFSTATDVFSFGVTCCEALARKSPWHELDPLQAALKVLRGQRVTAMLPRDVDPRLRALAERCMLEAPKDRPPMEQVHRALLEAAAGAGLAQQLRAQTLTPAAPNEEGGDGAPSRYAAFPTPNSYRAVPDY